MEPSTLMHASYLDIVFDNRNKTYGGYELRKNYDRRLGKAALFLMLGTGVLTILSLISNPQQADIAQGTMNVVSLIKYNPVTIPKPLPKIMPPEIHRAQPIKTKLFTAPIITNQPIPEDKQMTEQKDIAKAQPGQANTEGEVATGIGQATGDEHGTGAIDKPLEAATLPMAWVSQMPQFAGNMNAYIDGQLRYPAQAAETGIEGRVIVQFVVNEDGAVSDIAILRGIGGGCDEEAIRMVSAMPKWKPGRQNGKPVKVFFTLPINFVLK